MTAELQKHWNNLTQPANQAKPLPIMAKSSPPAPPPTLGEKIRTAREVAGLTQLQLAHAAGYKGRTAGAYVSRIESGFQEPRLGNLGRIAEALGVRVEDLLT